jgi:hypothetical protein
MAKKAKTRGNQLTFTQEIADEVCKRMAAGETLRQVCRDKQMPPESTVRGWAVEDVQGFAAQYTRARETLLEHWADDIVSISDDGTGDTVIDEYGKPRQNTEWINRSKLRVDTRKWLLSKLRPDKYGEKLELSGDPKKPLVPIINVTIAPKPALTSQAGDRPTDDGD